MSTTTTPRHAPAGSSPAPAAPASFAPASALRRSRWSAVQDSAYIAAGVSERDSVEAEWVYKDKAGNEVFRLLGVVTPDGRRQTRVAHMVPEGWEAGEGEGPLPLYGLDRLPAGGVVFVLGSEPDADVAGVTMDLPAVTSAFGPGLARRSDWSPLAGRCVAVVPDNDERGRAYAREVAALLLALEPKPKVKVVELPGLPASGGVSEFDEELYRQSGKLPAEVGAEIRALADRAPLYRQPAAPGPQPADAAAAAASAAPPAGEPVLTELAQVAVEDVQWLWPGRIPLGKLTLLFGDPGLGKSLLTLDLAARVTVGAAWPDGSGAAPRGSVLLATAEDALGDTVRGRLERAGADAARVAALEAIRQPVDAGAGAGGAMGAGGPAGEAAQRPFTLADWRELEKAIEQRPEVRLVVIDPLSAYLGGCGGGSIAALRERLTPLAKVAERRRVALVLVTHLSRDPASRALHRASGSLAFVAAARSAWLLTADPKDPRRRLLLPAKNNLAPDRGGLAFRVADGAVAWEPEPVEATADAALAAGRRNRRKPGPAAAVRRATEAWLRARLAAGPAPVGDESGPAPGTLLAEAKAAGLSPRTLRRAGEAVGVVKLRCPHTDRSLWQLPAPAPADAPDEQALPGDGPK